MYWMSDNEHDQFYTTAAANNASIIYMVHTVQYVASPLCASSWCKSALPPLLVLGYKEWVVTGQPPQDPAFPQPIPMLVHP
jgi:hypothetical protein